MSGYTAHKMGPGRIGVRRDGTFVALVVFFVGESGRCRVYEWDIRQMDRQGVLLGSRDDRRQALELVETVFE